MCSLPFERFDWSLKIQLFLLHKRVFLIFKHEWHELRIVPVCNHRQLTSTCIILLEFIEQLRTLRQEDHQDHGVEREDHTN